MKSSNGSIGRRSNLSTLPPTRPCGEELQPRLRGEGRRPQHRLLAPAHKRPVRQLAVPRPDPATTHHSFLSSFSAVSTATIARNGAFFHIFRDLQDFHTFAPLRTQNFEQIHHFCQNLTNLNGIFRNFANFIEISRKSQRNLLKFCVQSAAKM